MSWPYSGNAGMVAASRTRPDDDFDELTIDFAEAFGFTVDRPSEMERRLHRAGYKDAHPQRTDGRHTQDGKDPS